MTAKELRQALEGVPDDWPVYVTVADLVTHTGIDYMRQVDRAEPCEPNGLMPNRFSITTGEAFGW